MRFFSALTARINPVFLFFFSLAEHRSGLGAKRGLGMAVVEEGSPSRRFWNSARRKEAVFASLTPFVVGLASGGLEIDGFRKYIAQDMYFLKAFARAYELAEDCADDDDDKSTINKLKQSVFEELKMHNSVLQKWGVDPTNEVNPNPATTKYTDFLIGTASGKVEGGKGIIATPFEKTKIAAYTVGAMTPCMRLYAHLGAELAVYLDKFDNHPYKDWIVTYTDKKFQDQAVQIEELLDKLSISLTGEELDVIGKLYQQAMKLEVDFFNSQQLTKPSIVPLIKFIQPKKNKLMIFSDFDLTCTTVDSSAILAEIAILTAQKRDQSEENSCENMRKYWNDLSSQYTEEYEQCIQELLPQEEVKQFEYEKLYEKLQHLSEFEKRSNSRVIKSDLLKGMDLENIKNAGQHLMLQDGCKNFFQDLVKSKEKEKLDLDVHVLSYCWCADLIRSAFNSVGCLEYINIHSNEFSYTNNFSTGEISQSIQSPIDKLSKFKSLIPQSTLPKDQNTPQSVYIGDSVGDLLCLLEADIGIVVGSSVSLRKVGKQFGVKFVPLFHGLVQKQKEIEKDELRKESGVLYTVSSWYEIYAFILGS
ncbi:hypothetical protein LUZ60_012228 [Juncus effusus]|nr:hypothetical protein LUZ60_012228 [Juncus effusus]